MIFFPYFAYTAVNVASVPQTNITFGQNIAIGSPGASQTLVQLPSNSAVLGQR
jgi:hypothetical protein